LTKGIEPESGTWGKKGAERGFSKKKKTNYKEDDGSGTSGETDEGGGKRIRRELEGVVRLNCQN